MNAPYKDPLTMLDLNYRMVHHVGNATKRKLEMFVTYPGKPEFKSMEIVYTKAAKAPKKEKGKKKKPEAKKE